ncbi:hypothetical protein [Psychroserpens luteolus]|uniref:hypothetical protein n=1 Tax=Psychroserpens luteolus TaxID=2855840 RepID=UPI001E5C0B8A|nr:hypothetical protein [Psychroserpens luteolus]MCD2257626.1 hypothetical protein [Psychroserpens luteolus]
MFQSKFLKEIQSQLPQNTSLIDAIATALDISYDAAHRRTSLKSKLSIDECIILARFYHIALDGLFETTDKSYISVEKTKHIHNEHELEAYFKNSHESLLPLLQQTDSRILYSAKDIPLFYTIGDDILSRFKTYVWLKLLDNSFNTKTFEQFSPSVGLIKSAKALRSLYQDLNTTEIWDITTINSTLKQIHFYNQAGQISNTVALELCDALKRLIKTISERVDAHSTQYKLYYNELLLMNNNVLVSTPNQQSLYVPFSILSYYLTSDAITCKQAEKYLNQQLQHSKLLNTSGEKEQRTFFNRMYAKVDALKQLISATQVLDFE